MQPKSTASNAMHMHLFPFAAPLTYSYNDKPRSNRGRPRHLHPQIQNVKSPGASNKPSCSNWSKSLDTGLNPSTELPSPAVLSVLISDRSCSTSCLSLSFASPRLECDFCRSWCLASSAPSSCSSCWTCFSLRSRKARWEARFWARRR